MRNSLLSIFIAVVLLAFPTLNHAQAPVLGAAGDFVLFSTSGAVTNAGTPIYMTKLTGNVGANIGAVSGFGNVDGQMHAGTATSILAAADLLLAYDQLDAAIPNFFPSELLGNGATLPPGTYSISQPATLNLDLYLDGQNDPDAVFIFQIDGAFSTGTNAKVHLINGALACNVFWKVEGPVAMGPGTTMRGTIVANQAAITMSAGDTLEGRALSINGAVAVSETMAYMPLGCGVPSLTGPNAPPLGTTACFGLFSADGAVTNAGITAVAGDVGTNVGLTTGFDPLLVSGTVHPSPDPATAQAAADLLVAYNLVNAMPEDIILMRPDLFGHDLVLTPHTYLMNGAVMFTDSLYLNAQGDTNAVFVIKTMGAFTTSTNARVKLVNGAQAKNVFWLVNGAVNINDGSIFNGTFLSNGEVNLQTAVVLNGRMLNMVGEMNTFAMNVNSVGGSGVSSGIIFGSDTVCQGETEVSYNVPVIDNTLSYVWILPAGATFNSGAGTDSITVNFDQNANTGTFFITVQALNSCGIGITTTSFEVTVKQTPMMNSVSDQILCGNELTDQVIFSGGPLGTTYSWTNDNFAIGLDSMGMGNINPFTTINTGSVADTGMVTVIPSLMGCFGDSTTFLYVVNPAAINAVQDQTVCNGALTQDVQFTGGDVGTTFTWTNDNTSIGLPASGNGDINAFNAINNGTQADTATVTAFSSFNGCDSDSTIFLIIVNPIPVMNAVSDQTLCGNQQTTAIDFNNNVTGTTYSWTNDNTDIGLPNSGIGSINPFTTVNNGTENDTANVTVTPSFMGCNGQSTTFSIIVEPSGLMDDVSDQTVCNGEMTADVVFSGGDPGTVYNWVNDNTAIGLDIMGSGNIAAFTAINNGTEADTATITVTPSPLGCGGTSQTFLIIVNPTPAIAPLFDQTVCNGAMTSDVVFIGTVDSPTFNWTNDNASIGLASSGTGDLAAFTASNTTSMPDTAMVTVTPTANGCAGMPTTFMFIVSPTPTVNSVADQVLCNNGMTNAVNFSGATAGTTYSWTNDNTTIGLAGNGNGNILAFTAINTGLLPEFANIIVTPSADGCDGSTQTFSYTVLAGSAINGVADQTLCNGATTSEVVFTGGLLGTTFSWTNDNTSTGLPASGNGIISPFTAINNGTVAQTSNITVTPLGSGCDAITTGFSITVNPTPTVDPIADQTLCNGQTTNAVNFSGGVAGTTYTWINNNPSIGLASGGNGNIASFTAINTGATTQTATITVTPSANGCDGATQSFTINVNPGSAVDAVADQELCNGASSTPVLFTGGGPGTTYNWTNSNPSIGLPASGSGDIEAFVADNGGTTTQTAIITVTPSGGTCNGSAITFTFTVYPSPTVNGVTDQTLCNGAATNAVNFSGDLAGTTYNWTNSNPSIGLPASGNGNIASFTAINTSGTAQTATIIVIPSASGCSGAGVSFTITVNPGSAMNAVADQTLCNGAPTSAIAFTGSAPGTTYNWTNSNPTIGLPASGSGNIASFIADNAGTTTQTATITVTPSGGPCNGPTTSFTITVYPIPNVNTVADQTLCGSALTTNVVLSGGVSGTTYSWTNSNTSIGLPANGSGSIAPFTAINNGTAPQTAIITVIPTVNGCNGAGMSFTITVNTVPVANATTSAPVCVGGSFSLNAETVVGATYAWSGPDGFTSTEQDNTIANASLANAGTYSLVVVADGCASLPSTVDVVVNVCPTPADLSIVKTVSNTIPTVGQQVVFTIVVTNNGPTDATGVTVTEILQSGYTYVSSSTSGGTFNTTNGIWNIGNMANGSSQSLSVTATVNAAGTYTNTATVSGNQEDPNMANNISFSETFPTDFFIPEGFSPNGDGVNDVFFIRGLDLYTTNSIVIFNRWGNRIFEASPYINNWDGKSTAGLSLGSDDLPMGTYFFLLDLGNGSDVIKGTIFISK